MLAPASSRSVAELTPEEWERMIGLNLTGVYYCCHEILPIFKQGGGGDVVNIGSLAGKNAFAGGAAYNASKFGLNGFSEAMMLDHRHDGVRVSQLCREAWTPSSAGSGLDGGKPTERQNAWKIAPEDIADIVVTHAADASQNDRQPDRSPAFAAASENVISAN